MLLEVLLDRLFAYLHWAAIRRRRVRTVADLAGFLGILGHDRFGSEPHSSERRQR
jgi:hypothetical protein